MRQNKLIDAAFAGAKKLLGTCLPLNSGDVLALFSDGTTQVVRSMVLRAAKEAELVVRDRFVPVQYQTKFQGTLSNEDQTALGEARGILTCLSSNPTGTGYRHELLRVGPSFDNFFGHMPGANLTVLASAVNIDYVTAERRCDDLALALSIGRRAILRTYDIDQRGEPLREYVLHLDLIGAGRSPITSTGIIPKGTWGNIPGGEVFIAPMEESAHGKFALNGAFKSHVLPRGKSITLVFEGGRLVNVEGQGPSFARFDRLLGYVRRQGGENYNVLAELGVGVNPGVADLTGISLMDEKCAGTCHIAIGSNTRYGGSSSADTHEDFITTRPSLEIDGKPILSFGADALDSRLFRESLDGGPVEGFVISPTTFLFLNNEVKVQRGTNNSLRIRRFVAEGRICEYTVGDSQTSPVLLSLLQSLPGTASNILLSAEKVLGLSGNIGARGLSILLRHRVICRAE